MFPFASEMPSPNVDFGRPPSCILYICVLQLSVWSTNSTYLDRQWHRLRPPRHHLLTLQWLSQSYHYDGWTEVIDQTVGNTIHRHNIHRYFKHWEINFVHLNKTKIAALTDGGVAGIALFPFLNRIPPLCVSLNVRSMHKWKMLTFNDLIMDLLQNDLIYCSSPLVFKCCTT